MSSTFNVIRFFRQPEKKLQFISSNKVMVYYFSQYQKSIRTIIICNISTWVISSFIIIDVLILIDLIIIITTNTFRPSALPSPHYSPLCFFYTITCVFNKNFSLTSLSHYYNDIYGVLHYTRKTFENKGMWFLCRMLRFL